MSVTDPMAQKPLSSAELESLRVLTHGSARRRISSLHAQTLVEHGCARETADGVMITQLGRATVASRFPDWPGDCAA